MTLQKDNPSHPDTILPSLRDIAFVCPLCRGELDVADQAYRCEPCSSTYPLHGGIPDFRVFADPYISLRQDAQRTELVLGVLEEYDLRRLLDYYWSHSDITPPDLKAKFIRNALLAERRGRRLVQVLENGPFRQSAIPRRVLEVGSGTGNFLVAAAGRYEQVVGTDIAMRWLHISRRRAREAGQADPALVCCCAEHLPFADRTFDLAVSSATLEFTREPGRALAEGSRVLRNGGGFLLNTANRYSIAVNPYAYLWGLDICRAPGNPATFAGGGKLRSTWCECFRSERLNSSRSSTSRLWRSLFPTSTMSRCKPSRRSHVCK